MDERLLPGRYREAVTEVTQDVSLWRDGAAAAAAAAEKREWQFMWLQSPTFTCPRRLHGGNPKEPGIRGLGTSGCGARSC